MHAAIYKQITQRLLNRERAVLRSRFCANGGAEMQKDLLPPDSAGYALALENGAPILRAAEGISTFLEPFFPEERLIVLGAGHIALSLADFAAKTGFSVVVFDDRPSFANVQRFPSAAGVICDNFDNLQDRLGVTAGDYVVIITRGHRHDRICLEQLNTGLEPFYTGMIGSRRRTAALKADLIENGADEGRMNRVHTPIGLDIGGVTPAEIAVSIMAELIQCKHGGGAPISRSESDTPLLHTLADEPGTPKAIVTVMAAKGSVPRGPGAKMLVYPDGRLQGSIGGGCAEAEVIGIARGIIGSRMYRTHRIDLTAEIAEEEGMVCGGVMDVLIEDNG